LYWFDADQARCWGLVKDGNDMGPRIIDEKSLPPSRWTGRCWCVNVYRNGTDDHRLFDRLDQAPAVRNCADAPDPPPMFAEDEVDDAVALFAIRRGARTAWSRSTPLLDCRQEWRIELDPRRVPIILAIGTGICVGLVGYLA